VLVETGGRFVEEVDEQVATLLTEGGIIRPPVDAIHIARRLGIAVIRDADQQPRGRQALVAGRPSIFVRPDERSERTQWAVAHELGESLIHRFFQSTGFDAGDVDPRTREQAANLAASRILLPTAWFREDAMHCDGDLLTLKRHYATASHELIAFRLLDLRTPTVISVFDQGQQTRRRGSTGLAVPPLDRLEQECWLTVHRFGRFHESADNVRRVQGWPIHEPGWQREILRTTFVDCEPAIDC
jgi:Zn-dependent peptidase ImmA (M78 family)